MFFSKTILFLQILEKVLTNINSHGTIKVPSKSGTSIKEMAYNEHYRRSNTKSKFTEN